MAEDEDANIISRMEKNKAYIEKEGVKTHTDYAKYAVGGESKEVPASTGLHENRNFNNKRKQNQKDVNKNKV